MAKIKKEEEIEAHILLREKEGKIMISEYLTQWDIPELEMRSYPMSPQTKIVKGTFMDNKLFCSQIILFCSLDLSHFHFSSAHFFLVYVIKKLVCLSICFSVSFSLSAEQHIMSFWLQKNRRD